MKNIIVISWHCCAAGFGKRKCRTLLNLESRFMNTSRQNEKSRRRKGAFHADATVFLLAD